MYFNNIFLQCCYLNASKYDIGVICHGITNQDPDIHTEVESNYSGHLQNIPWDALSQTCALKKILVVARQAEF